MEKRKRGRRSREFKTIEDQGKLDFSFLEKGPAPGSSPPKRRRKRGR